MGFYQIISVTLWNCLHIVINLYTVKNYPSSHEQEPLKNNSSATLLMNEINLNQKLGILS